MTLIEDLRPITNLVLLGSVGFLLKLSIISMPPIILGFSDFGAARYIGFYGIHYLSVLLVFFSLSYGFHVAMMKEKNIHLRQLGDTLNTRFSTFEADIISNGT